MPRLFVDLGDDLERWFREESEDLLDSLYHEFSALLKKVELNMMDLLVYLRMRGPTKNTISSYLRIGELRRRTIKKKAKKQTCLNIGMG